MWLSTVCILLCSGVQHGGWIQTGGLHDKMTLIQQKPEAVKPERRNIQMNWTEDTLHPTIHPFFWKKMSTQPSGKVEHFNKAFYVLAYRRLVKVLKSPWHVDYAPLLITVQEKTTVWRTDPRAWHHLPFTITAVGDGDSKPLCSMLEDEMLEDWLMLVSL